jgi:hypothetical protein
MKLYTVLAMLAITACGGGSGAPQDTVTPGDAEVLGEGLTDASPDAELVEAGCTLAEGDPAPHSLPGLGCPSDFQAMASRPLDGSIPGARSSKTVIDQADSNALYILNAVEYPIHYDFCLQHLSGHGLPPVGDMGTFSSVEYYSPYRRFLLGALTHYEGPDKWVYEIAPYDTSLPDMVTTAYDLLAAATFVGTDLYFHPTSESVERLLPDLPPRVKVITTDELFAGIDYLPLNLGTSAGQLRFLTVDDLESGAVFVTPRDVVVLDRVPNDISVVAGIITAEVQTPLSHVNVLSQNRGTPNMVLLGAMEEAGLRALEGQWVRLTVGAFEYSVTQTTKEEADAWWEAHKPPQVKVPELDLGVTDLRDCQELRVDDVPAFGGKASNYGELLQIGEAVPVSPALAVPVYYYRQFEQQNGFDVRIEALLADPDFQADIAVRDEELKKLRKDFKDGVLDGDLLDQLQARLDLDFPGQRLRVRSSTNAEDLDGFTGAGLYESKTYDPADPDKPLADAVREVYASLWNLRAFEERAWRGIDQRAVAMALLIARSFPAEDANGVALTANIFDEIQPAFYINVQQGDTSVVLPPAGVTTDQFLYYFTYPGQPMTFFGHSSLVPEGETVLTKAQAYRLGQALQAVHQHFSPIYQHAGKFYAMDVEFKFNTDTGDPESRLWVKQARPHPGWGVGTEQPEVVEEGAPEVQEVVEALEDTATQEVPDVDQEAWAQQYGSGCALDQRVGRFEITHDDGLSFVTGQVADGVNALAVLQPKEAEGPCQLLMRENPFCEPACPVDQQCTQDGRCEPFPTPLSAGTVSITGLVQEAVLQPGALGNYAKYDFEAEAFLPGWPIELSAAGAGAVPAFTLQGSGVPLLSVADQAWSVKRDVPTQVSWTPSAGPGTIHLSLNVDQHGVTPVTLFCEVADTGSLTIPVALTNRLLDYGVSGAASGMLQRRTVDSVELPQGCVELTVSSRVKAKPQAQ